MKNKYTFKNIIKVLYVLIFQYEWSYRQNLRSGLWDDGAVGRSGLIATSKFGDGMSSRPSIIFWDEDDDVWFDGLPEWLKIKSDKKKLILNTSIPKLFEICLTSREDFQRRNDVFHGYKT